MKTVTNTTKVEQNAGWLFGGNPRAIEAQEARGQKELVESEVLPAECQPKLKAELEAAGVRFLEVVPDDKMFQKVELPAGWRKKSTDHDMWSNLVDGTGKVRAMIFYKAAFYDRSAFMSAP